MEKKKIKDEEEKENRITVETRYTLPVLDTFWTHNLKQRKSMKFIFWCGIVIVALAVVLLACKEYITGILDMLCGFIFVFYMPIVKLSMRHVSKGTIGKLSRYEFTDEAVYSYELDETGNIVSSAMHTYTSLDRIEMNNNFLYIFIGKAMAYIIDKTKFSSQDDYNKILNLLADKIYTPKNNQKKAK